MIHSEFLEPAEKEMLDAAAFYESRSEGLGKDFIQKVYNAVKDIEETPERWPVLEFNIHRRFIHRFPYAVLYKIENGKPIIVAVMHLSRRPNYWFHRIKK